MSYETLCPECEGPLTLRDPMAGEIVPCPACGADLEVVASARSRSSWRPKKQEDWGE